MTETPPASLDVPAARELLADDRALLVDVRTPGEFGAVHVPGSYNVPLDRLRAHAAELSTADPIVLLCASGDRAEQARGLIAGTAERATAVAGGLQAWERAGAPVVRSAGTWSMERQVRFTAGLLVLCGVLGSLVAVPLRWVAGFVGAGLTFSGITNTCGMARVLSLLPHNRSRPDDTRALLTRLSTAD